MSKMYRVIIINNKTKQKTYMSSPSTHSKSCVLLNALTKYPFRIETLEEVN